MDANSLKAQLVDIFCMLSMKTSMFQIPHPPL